MVELVIITAVIALLAVISVVAYNGARARSRDASRSMSISTIKKALDLYRLDNGAYPSVCGADDAGCSITSLSTALSPAYIPTVPNDPNAGAGFSYVRRAGGLGYGIYIPGYETMPACKTGIDVNPGWWGAGVPTC